MSNNYNDKKKDPFTNKILAKQVIIEINRNIIIVVSFLNRGLKHDREIFSFKRGRSVLF